MRTFNKSKEELKKELDPDVYHITQEKGTEPPFTGKYDHHFEKGTYYCTVCGTDLFTSDTKYDSGCGWPAFYEPVSTDSLEYHEDTSFGMKRTEVTCGNCGAHLGHVFPDGPKDKTGERYCINSASLNFKRRNDEK
ncbi:peptide-methionine (R)-S-oxide reductase MsrB [Candidatus Roizmanbacteria bacterium]|nr:MAG: peptide-methionine (R)-S-oxide reductase MsrB [Candidatus Roizmanbacteria bacterium]